MLTLNSENYFSPEATKDYWSVSSFKHFCRCEAAALASVKGETKSEPSTALLVGSYVDARFTGDLGRFALDHPEIFKKDGSLKSDYVQAETMIARVKEQPLMMDFLKGQHQVVMSAELFDVPWKIKMDVCNGKRIVDLKTVRDFNDIYEVGFGYRSWIEYWGYDIQGAIYQKIEQLAMGRDKPLPFYLVAVTKEKIPDVEVIQIPQYVLDTALEIVHSKIDRFDLVKKGLIPPSRCGHCNYCKETKVLTEPMVYDTEEA